MSSPNIEGEESTAAETVEQGRQLSVDEEDPLVIDENEKSKDKEKTEGDGEDNEEREFEPTVDMLMNEFDDEATIEEEEALDQDDEADELTALQDEQDMPIEELLKMYGGAGYTQPTENYAKGQEVEGGCETEGENSHVNEETSKETFDSETLQKGEPTKEAVVSSEAETGEEPESLPKGEKRSSSTPPPAKKSRSELAK